MVGARERPPARARILAEATRLFASRGEGATSLQEVADAVGVSKPAVLHHFPSKEALRDAVFDGIVEHWNTELPRLLLEVSSAGDRFEAVFGALWRFFATDAERTRLVLREVLDRPAELRKLARGPMRPWVAAVAEHIRVGVARGTHHADVDPEAYVVHALQLALTGVVAQSVSQVALGPDAPVASQRYERELFRIAKAALFKPVRKPKG